MSNLAIVTTTYGERQDQRIEPACPACGGTLFLGTGGWLTCSYLKCSDPFLATKLLQAERVRRCGIARHEAALERLKKSDPLSGKELAT